MSHIARGGFRNEDWVARQFNDGGSPYGTTWLKIMGYGQPEKVCAQTARKMGFFNKADVLVLVDDAVEWVSVKKFTASSSFNQLDKRWVGEFAKLWSMPDGVSCSLKRYCGEEGHRPADILGPSLSTRDERRFFMDELSADQQEAVISFLGKTKKRIIRDVMAGRGKGAARWILAVEERQDAPPKSVLVPMNAAVRHCAEGPAVVTKAGSLKLGRITIQRKGGDAGEKTARMLQFKFSPKELFNVGGAQVFQGPIDAQRNNGRPHQDTLRGDYD